MQRWFVGLSAILLVSCATAAQRQVQQSETVFEAVAADFKACVQTVWSQPKYALLRLYSPDLNTGEYPMSLLTDEQLPTPEEAQLFAARHDEGAHCRSALMQGVAVARPDLMPAFVNLMNKGTHIAIQVVERKITWAEAARGVGAATAELQQTVAAADQQRQGLTASHQAELANRQAAADLLMQWSAQQQMLNVANRTHEGAR